MKKIKKSNKLITFKLVDKNGNSVSLIMVALAIVFALSSISIVFGVNSLLSEEKSSILDFDSAYFISDNGIIKDEIVVETGNELPEIKDYFMNGYDIPETTTVRYSDAYQVFNVNDFTIVRDEKRYVKGIQDLYVFILHDGIEYESILRIVDTIKPEVAFKNSIITVDEEINVDNFIDSYSDNSLVNDYTATIKNSVSTKVVGTYDVTIEVCDLGGNCVRDVTKLTVKDNEAN